MAGVKLISHPLSDRQTTEAMTSGRKSRLGSAYLLSALKFFVLVPVFPFLAYMLLDQTGVSAFMVNTGLIPKAILGEGFGHVGLCFSIHYIFRGIRALAKGTQLMWQASRFA